MTFQHINILPTDKSTWQIHKGFEIVPGTNLGYFKWKYGGKTSTDMKLFDAVSAANNYAEELNLVARINNPPQIKIENASSELSLFLSDRNKNYSAWVKTVTIPWSKHYRIDRWWKVNLDAANLLLSLDPSSNKSYWINDGRDFPQFSPSERKDYEMSLLSYLENLGYVKIDSFLKKVNITDAGYHLHKKYSK